MPYDESPETDGAERIAVPQAGQVVEITAEGATLSGRFFRAEGQACRAGLVIHAATGVPQGFYRAFAEWAAGQGIAVLTYDYRDFGASATGHARDSKASFADWMLKDQRAAEVRLAELVSEGPLWMLGHSLGGLGFPFRPLEDRMERIITFGSGFAYHWDHPWHYMPAVFSFWFWIIPVLTRFAGYMPGRKLLLGTDLPARVYWQWRHWCTSRDFYLGEVGVTLPQPDFSAQGRKIRILASPDDVMVPPSAVGRYAGQFDEGAVKVGSLQAQKYGLRKLGHIDAFSIRNKAAWADMLGI
ncbi:MAG: alpha/beta fold hydrolase [Alphaproteobacteria bacterium]